VGGIKMTSNEFCIWLEGYLEAKGAQISEFAVETIVDKLKTVEYSVRANLVFDPVFKPREPDYTPKWDKFTPYCGTITIINSDGRNTGPLSAIKSSTWSYKDTTNGAI